MEQRSLVALVNESAKITQQIIESDGVITPELENLLKDVEQALPEKIDGYAAVIERIGFEIDYYKAQADQFKKVTEQLKTLDKALKDRLLLAMNTLEKDRIEGNGVYFKKIKNSLASLVDTEGEKLDSAYLKVVYEPDNERIRADLETGIPVKGKHLEQGFHVRKFIKKGQ